MNKPVYVKNTIMINASSAKVWDALTNPEQTRKYMFGCETVSDWKPGSALLWKGHHEGQDVIFVKGKIVEIKPGKILVYTIFDPNGKLPDLPENYLTVTYSLSEAGNHTELTVTQGDFSTVGDGQRRFEEASNNGEGWNPILVEIKKLVEA